MQAIGGLHGRTPEDHASPPAGIPVLRSISLYRHDVVNIPLARLGSDRLRDSLFQLFPLHPKQRRPSPF